MSWTLDGQCQQQRAEHVGWTDSQYRQSAWWKHGDQDTSAWWEHSDQDKSAWWEPGDQDKSAWWEPGDQAAVGSVCRDRAEVRIEPAETLQNGGGRVAVDAMLLKPEDSLVAAATALRQALTNIAAQDVQTDTLTIINAVCSSLHAWLPKVPPSAEPPSAQPPSQDVFLDKAPCCCSHITGSPDGDCPPDYFVTFDRTQLKPTQGKIWALGNSQWYYCTCSAKDGNTSEPCTAMAILRHNPGCLERIGWAKAGKVRVCNRIH